MRYLCASIFFNRSLCHLWEATEGISVEKTAFGKDSHMPRTVVPKVRSKHLLSDHFSPSVSNIFRSGLFPPCTHGGLPKKAKTSVKKSQARSRFPRLSRSGTLGNLVMCSLFLTDSFSMYGAPRVPYRVKRIHSDWTNTRRENID